MSLRTLSFSRVATAASVLIAAVPLLAFRGCEEPGDPGGCFCTEEYAPVCGADGTTYSNACHADCSGAMIAHDGECESACVCPALYAPVCGTDGHTYGNSCEANCAGAMVSAPGPCECPAMPPLYCEWGYVTDERGCPAPECLPPPECPPVLCDVYCEHGHATDERGCELCACNPPPEPTTCFADDECGIGSYCDTSECLSPCGPDAEGCIAVCAGACRPIPPPPAGCSTDADCAAGEICALPCAFFADPGDELPPECLGACVTPDSPPSGGELPMTPDTE